MKQFNEYPVAHIGFVVKDAEKTANKFKDLFGINDFQVYDFSPTRAWSYGKEVIGYKLKIAMAKMPGKDTKIEIIQPISSEGLHHDFVTEGNSGIHHICYAVDDYDFWREHFKKQNADIVFESETEDSVIGYRRCFYAKDMTLGCIYEIKENPYFRK